MIHVQGQEQPQYLRGNDPLRDPLCYPLLLPHGDLGWGLDNTYDCEHAEYLRYRMLIPEEGLEMQTQSRQRYVVNRFQLFSRVAQVYLVDTISRIEDNRLNFIRSHQARSEEHTSELQSLMRISYAVFCLKKKKT